MENQNDLCTAIEPVEKMSMCSLPRDHRGLHKSQWRTPDGGMQTAEWRDPSWIRDYLKGLA